MPSIIRGDDDFDSDIRGSLRHISQTVVSSAVSSVDFTGFDSSEYDNYLVVLSDVTPVTDAVYLWCRTSTDGGSTFDSGGSDYEWLLHYNVSTAKGSLSSFGNALNICGFSGGNGVSNTSTELGVTGELLLVRPEEAARCVVQSDFAYSRNIETAYKLTSNSVVGYRDDATAVNGLRFLFHSGNIASGKFDFYGIKGA